jgi:hypothetical protein
MGWLGEQKTKHPSTQAWACIRFQQNEMTMKGKNLNNVGKWYECLCTFFNMFSQRWSTILSNSYSNGGMEAWTIIVKKSQTHLKWGWNGNGNGLELLALITPNKNG